MARTLPRAIFPAAALALLTATFAVAPAAHAAPGADSGPRHAVIVEGTSVAAATTAVQAAGGTLELALPLVNGVSAEVGAGGLAALSADPNLQVMPDMAPAYPLAEVVLGEDLGQWAWPEIVR